MRSWTPVRFFVLVAAGLTALAGCTDRDPVYVTPGIPSAPRALDGWYYDRAVHLVWEPAADWSGESFRVYGKRTSDPDYFLIAEVTNCTGGVCTYTDVNLVSGVTYEYFLTSIDSDRGVESDGSYGIEVFVPAPVPPPAPADVDAVALDGAVYLLWDAAPRDESDFSHYRVYMEDPGGGADFLLGETDSEGFLDERVENGGTYTYRISSLDDQGHESGTSGGVTRQPRPDYHGEWIRAYQDRPELSGFLFETDETFDPIVPGYDGDVWDFRLEVDAEGWWIVPSANVPGGSTHINVDAYATTALKCGPASDADCTDVRFAPVDGYTTSALEALPGTTYVLRVVDGGQYHYGAVRVELLGTDQNGDAIAIFDWAFQLVPGSVQLEPRQGLAPAY